MKKVIIAASLVAMAFLSSCSTVQAPLVGALYTGLDANQTVTANALGNKVGRAKATAILGVATGDVSVQTAAKSAGITKISHVDTRTDMILGIYGSYEIIVYGE